MKECNEMGHDSDLHKGPGMVPKNDEPRCKACGSKLVGPVEARRCPQCLGHEDTTRRGSEDATMGDTPVGPSEPRREKPLEDPHEAGQEPSLPSPSPVHPDVEARLKKIRGPIVTGIADALYLFRPDTPEAQLKAVRVFNEFVAPALREALTREQQLDALLWPDGFVREGGVAGGNPDNVAAVRDIAEELAALRTRLDAATEALKQADKLYDHLVERVDWGKTFRIDFQLLNETGIAVKAALSTSSEPEPTDGDCGMPDNCVWPDCGRRECLYSAEPQEGGEDVVPRTDR